jgi:hypothetical protein
MALTSSGARENITLTVGDSVNPRFSIKTDTVLAAIGNSTIVARHCGTSSIFLRVWRGVKQLSADTITATVTCPTSPVDTTPKPDTLMAAVGVCFISPDSATKYGIRGDRSLDSGQIALIQPWCKKADTLQLAPAASSLIRKA